jgi:hypothetical protein
LISSEIPLPGDYFGFVGLLAKQNISAVNAFSTALLFLLIMIASIVLAVTSFDLPLAAMVRLILLQNDRFAYSQAHLGRDLLLIVSRVLFVSFFATGFLATLQFSFLASTGAAALACLVLLAFQLLPDGAACESTTIYSKRCTFVLCMALLDPLHTEYIYIDVI